MACFKIFVLWSRKYFKFERWHLFWHEACEYLGLCILFMSALSPSCSMFILHFLVSFRLVCILSVYVCIYICNYVRMRVFIYFSPVFLYLSFFSLPLFVYFFPSLSVVFALRSHFPFLFFLLHVYVLLYDRWITRGRSEWCNHWSKILKLMQWISAIN